MSQKLIDQIVERLRHARRIYYSGAKPVMTDAQFDALEDRLRELDPDNAFFRGVGFAATDAFEKVEHTVPMTSLNKVQTYEELAEWYNGVVLPHGLFITDKCDGISLSLRYIDGKLVRGATRGDGQVGEDITRNALKMEGVVQVLPHPVSGHTRGEVVLRKSKWRKHFPTYVNPRNAASGIAKRLDGEGSEHLTVLCYQFIPDNGSLTFLTKDQEFQFLEDLGFLTTRSVRAATPTYVNDIYQQYIDGIRESLDYDIDGLVVEVNDLRVASKLGLRDHRPEGARAFKFPHDEAMTTLRNVEWQVGVTGRITPVGHFDPIGLAGATIAKASLSNHVLIEELGGLRYGDQISVSRRNDVIPKIESVILQSDEPLFQPPTECPCCGQQLQVDNRYITCINDECPAQVAGGIRRWCARLELKGWGPALINALCEAGWVYDASDLYAIDPDRLAELEMDGRKVGNTAYIVMSELRTKTEVTLDILVGSMGIPNCGRSITRMLMAAGYDTLEKLESMTLDEAQAVPGLGPVRAEIFTRVFPTKLPIIQRLLGAGVKLKVKNQAVGILSGKTVCMTGFRDKELTAAIEAAGGTVKDSVGKGLTYLVAKDKGSGSGKIKKAIELGTFVVDTNEMLDIIKGNGN